MIINELEEYKNKKIKEHIDKYPELRRENNHVVLSDERIKEIENSQVHYEDDLIFEMFQKKYKEEYYDSSYSSKLQPFINQIYLSKSNFWDDRHFDAKTMPRLEKNIYKEIEQFPDYDYLNGIAYEMLIRTSEFSNLRDNSNCCSSDEREKRFEQLGLNMNDVINFQKISNHFGTTDNKNFTYSYFGMTLNDLDHGLDKLIQFYMDKKEIYIIDKVEKIALYAVDGHKNERIVKQTYKIVSNITIEEVKNSLLNYYIPTKFNFQTPTLEDKFSRIDSNLPLVALERDFLLSIDDLIPNRKKGAINFNFTRPLLSFKELPIVDVPLNLNLPIEELIQLVSKLKNDFKDGIVKNLINILYDTEFKFEELKNLTPFKMTKKSMAEAFFIYDLYQFINETIKLHKSKLRHLQEMDFQEVEEDTQFKIKEKELEISQIIDDLKKEKNQNDQQQNKSKKPFNKLIKENKYDFKTAKRKLQKDKKKELNKINSKYKKYSLIYHPMIVLENIAILYDITPYMCKQYLKFMRKYIDNLQYKELIIGVKVANY